jgi:hypothetical protein
MNISRVGVDIAKSVFHVHGVDRHDQVQWRGKYSRGTPCVSVHSTTFCHPAENRPTVTSHFPTRGYPHETAPHTRTVAGSGQSAA